MPTPVAEPLAQYLIRRDLTTLGLYQFDDKPENYRAWYISFTNTINGINLSAAQQLDLMTKWLGKESSEYVKRICSVYVGNPTEVLRKAWKRVHDCYVTPEIMERLLFQRLDSFPRLTNRDHAKLHELGDLLTEILGAKEDGYLTGLSYLNTSRGISPISEKLPFSLQEKWLSTGSMYMEKNNGRSPPFKYFCGFVCHEAKKRNDLSSMHQGSTATPIKPERSASRKFNDDRTFSVAKLMFPQPKPTHSRMTTWSRHARCITNHTLSRIAEHSGTNQSKNRRPSSRRKVYVSNAVLPPLTLPRTVSPQLSAWNVIARTM